MSTSVLALDRPLLDQLGRVVGPRAVIADPDRLLVFESDGLTQYRKRPSAVILPGDADELQRVVRILHQAGRHYVPRGAGTGLSGGALAVDGAVVVATTRMNRILEIDPVRRRARVEPGVVNAHLTRATTPHGLYYAPDPSSQSACTLGGNVAENSGGPHCLKYGVTLRYVTGLSVVLPDGDRVALGSLARSGSAGPPDRGLDGPPELDLTGLFVGSEGCFGVATEIEVALLPVPEGVRTLLALFDSLEEAGAAVSEIIGRGLLPAALEIIDRATIQAVEASVFAAGFPTDVAAALVVEFDGVDAALDAEVDEARDACMSSGATEVRTAADEEERSALWKGRKKAFGAMGRIAPDLLVQDATVPRSRLPEVLARVDEIGRRFELRVANVFHAGDGNLHPNLLFDRNDPDELARVEDASREIMQVCVEAGGTITGEHGVGLDKRKYLPMVLSPQVMRTMAGVKAVFDPSGLCNPGKVLPDEYLSPAGAAAASDGKPGSGGDPTVAPASGTASGRASGRASDRASGRASDRASGTASDRASDRASGTGSVRARATDVATRVARLLGNDGVEVHRNGTHRAGAPVARPSDAHEAAALLRVASEEGWRVLPMGAGVGFDAGVRGGEGIEPGARGPAGGRGGSDGGSGDEGTPRADLVVATTRLGGVADYEPADLTLRCGAGLTLAALDGTLARESQWLPLDPPGGGGVTLGGVVATGIPGPLATAFGRPRDLVLGLTLVDGRGQVLELGGRVVKNVAGFDLVRLACGSRGALGLVCGVSLRLFPRPGVDRTLEWAVPDTEEGMRLGRTLAGLPFILPGLELWLDGDAGGRLRLRLLGSEAEVARIDEAARSRAGSPSRVVDGRPNAPRPARAVDLLTGSVRVRDVSGSRQRSDLEGTVLRLHRDLRRVFDPRAILPGAWRWGWR